MEKILVVGTNTRPIACSLKKLEHTVYSSDYFGCIDLNPCVNRYKSSLSQVPFQSCGFFSENFRSEDLIGMAMEFYSEADSIICSSGVSPSDLPKNKIIGNTDVKGIENKYRLYKALNKKFGGIFKIPETFLVSDIEDAMEIADVHHGKKFLLKPLEGSGGIGIRNLDELNHDYEMGEALLQEIVQGHDISTSVLSNGYDAKTILTSSQIIGNLRLGQVENYGYCGNISPHTLPLNDSMLHDIKKISEDIIKKFKLIGSNGVDMVIKDKDIYVIEVNPRIQGTFEVAEECLGVNMVDSHIKACEGELPNMPSPEKFAVKKVVFAKHISTVGSLNFEGVHDKPGPNVIIEKGEPVCTVLTSGHVLENVFSSSQLIVDRVYGNLKSPIS